MSSGTEALQSGYNGIIAHVRGMTDAVRELPDDEMLRVVESLGAIATGALSLRANIETLEQYDDAHTQQPAAPVEETPRIVRGLPESILPVIVTEPDEPVRRDPILADPQPIVLASVSDGSTANLLRSPELQQSSDDSPWTSRESELLRYITSLPVGQEVRPAELIEVLSDTTSRAAKARVVTKFLQKLSNRQKYGDLRSSGATVSRRYWFEPPSSNSSDETTVEEVTEASHVELEAVTQNAASSTPQIIRPTPGRMPAQRPVRTVTSMSPAAQAEVNAANTPRQLTDWGLAAQLTDGRVKLYVNGIETAARGTAVKILLELAKHDEEISLQDLRIKLSRNQKIDLEPVQLLEAIARVKQFMEDYADDSLFVDKNIGNADDQRRFVQLRGVLPENIRKDGVDQHFLAER